MTKLFGTDGVRGLANRELTPELAFQLGRAAGTLFKEPGLPAAIIVGRDTRLSGSMLEGALAAGICSAGVDVYAAGIIPTPAIAYLTRTMETCAGAVISASHNPAPDNGIKFFNHQGFKLADELEEQIEKLIASGMEGAARPTGGEIGKIIPFPEGSGRYAEFLKSTVNCDFQGLKIVLDCANGAAFQVAPKVFQDLGAQVISLGDLPDGENINDGCGSTHPELLQEAVKKFKARLGLAFDGDADRVIAVDEKGQIVNGDSILVICGLALQKKRDLNGKVVVTIMSNLGLKQAFEKAQVEVLETKVGDRYVLEKMVETGAVLGGEQSGHIIFLRHNTTGDGIVTGLQLLETLTGSGGSLSGLAAQMPTLPQVLKNVRVSDKEKWDGNQGILRAVRQGEQVLLGRGRLLVRSSGTEPLIRVMAEGPDGEELEEIAGRVAEAIQRELG